MQTATPLNPYIQKVDHSFLCNLISHYKNTWFHSYETNLVIIYNNGRRLFVISQIRKGIFKKQSSTTFTEYKDALDYFMRVTR